MTWFFIITGIIAAISGGFVIWFFIKSWSKLTLLDAHKLPEVKESSKKDEILRRRAAQTEAGKKPQLSIFSIWVLDLWQRIQTKFREQVDALERTLLDEKRVTKTEPLTDQEIGARNHQIKLLLREADRAVTENALDAAEKKYIAVLSLDEHNADAYVGLGNVYFAEEQFNEARETYRYALKLNKNNESALMRLAEIAEHNGKLEDAVEYYEQAVLLNDSLSPRYLKIYDLLIQLNQPETALIAIEQALALEPQNPKYLDNFITASILVGDKNKAEDGYQRLRMVNPENQKLPAFRERIDALA